MKSRRKRKNSTKQHNIVRDLGMNDAPFFRSDRESFYMDARIY